MVLIKALQRGRENSSWGKANKEGFREVAYVLGFEEPGWGGIQIKGAYSDGERQLRTCKGSEVGK